MLPLNESHIHHLNKVEGLTPFFNKIRITQKFDYSIYERRLQQQRGLMIFFIFLFVFLISLIMLDFIDFADQGSVGFMVKGQGLRFNQVIIFNYLIGLLLENCFVLYFIDYFGVRLIMQKYCFVLCFMDYFGFRLVMQKYFIDFGVGY